MTSPTVTGIILAGGASRRMGRNKALISLAGQPLVSRVVEALQPLTSEILLVTNDPAAYRFLNLPMVPDEEPGQGPLMGLYSGLRAAPGDLALAIAVDMPFLSPDILGLLLSLASDVDVVIPRAFGRLHPLCAVYRRATCLPAIETALRQGQRRLIAFHPLVKVRVVEEPLLREMSPDLRALMNVNTPEELARARALLRP